MNKCTYTKADTHTHFSKESYSSGMAQVAESCQDVSLEVDSHDNQGRSDMAIAYCTVMSHYDLISHISSAPVCWICTENTGIDL